MMKLHIPWRTYEISTVVDQEQVYLFQIPWRTYEISTVVDINKVIFYIFPWRTYEISTVVDIARHSAIVNLGEPMKFLLL